MLVSAQTAVREYQKNIVFFPLSNGFRCVYKLKKNKEKFTLIFSSPFRLMDVRMFQIDRKTLDI